MGPNTSQKTTAVELRAEDVFVCLQQWWVSGDGQWMANVETRRKSVMNIDIFRKRVQCYPVVQVAPRSALPIARASDGHESGKEAERARVSLNLT
jgi:hypothetical protein